MKSVALICAIFYVLAGLAMLAFSGYCLFHGMDAHAYGSALLSVIPGLSAWEHFSEWRRL